MNTSVIRAQYGGSSSTSFMYSKSYTKRIDNLRMPFSYQLIRQFIQSLKGNAFEWYKNMDLEVINSWKQLEIEFPNRFYSTRRILNMMKLTNTKQWKESQPSTTSTDGDLWALTARMDSLNCRIQKCASKTYIDSSFIFCKE